MGTTLNKKFYTQLIDEDIEELEKYMPKHSLEKSHIIDVLKWSIREIYKCEGSEEIDTDEQQLQQADVIKSVCQCEKADLSMEDNYCGKCGLDVKG